MKKNDYIAYMNNLKPKESCRDEIYQKIIAANENHENSVKENIDRADDKMSGQKHKYNNQKSHKITDRKKLSRIIGIAAAAVLCIVLVSGGGVYAFQHYVARYENHKDNYYDDHFAEITDANGNPYKYDNSKPIDETAEFQNLNITCNSTVYDEHNLYVKFHVETKDGSALVTNSEDVISNYVEQRFNKVYVYVDGKKLKNASGVESSENKLDRSNYRHEMQRVDNGETVNMAEFELSIKDESVKFTGHNIEILLSDYRDRQVIVKGIGYLFSSVAEMVKEDKLADETEFYKLDPEVYNLGSIDALKPGNETIYFSNAYPTAYVDNYGFKEDERFHHQAFYLTINPGEENADKLLNLVFQNKITGSINDTFYTDAQDLQNKNVGCYKLALPDGRIQLIFIKRNERGFGETTLEDLVDYTIKLNTNNDVDHNPIIANGSCRFDFKCNSEQSSDHVDYNIPATVIPSEIDDHSYTVTSMTIETAKVLVNGTFDEMVGDWKSNKAKGVETNIYLILKDGTKLECQVDGGGGKNGTYDMNIRWKLNTFIHPSDVVAIEWNGVTIEVNQ